MKKILNKIISLIKLFYMIPYAFQIKMSNEINRKMVIYYHDIPKSHLRKFRKQIEYLTKHFDIVKPSEIFEAKPNGFGPMVAITVDDSFENVYENALPILKEYHVPAGIFVPVGNLGKRPKWDFSEECEDRNQVITDMSQVLKMDRDGFEIYSHSYSHPRLSKIGKDELYAEIAGSKQALENILGHEVEAISYPYGDYDEKVCEAVADAGYSFGFTIDPSEVNNKTDRYRIGRCEVSSGESLLKFRLKCTGAFQTTAMLSKVKFVILNCLQVFNLKI